MSRPNLITAASHSHPKDPVRRNVYLLLAVFWLLSIAIALVGYNYYRRQGAALEAEERRQLTAIADLKVRQIHAWRQERLGNGRMIAASPISPALREFLTGAPLSAGAREEIAHWLEEIRSAGGYANAILVNPASDRWIAAGAHADSAAEYMRLANQVMTAGDTVLTDFHFDEGLPGPHVGVNIPVRLGAGERPAGAVLLGIDPDTFLYPLIQTWPTNSQSGETLLARREGNDVVYLNELRHRGSTALRLRIPMRASELPTARGLAGYQGIMTGIDYRGIPVLADVRKIPDTPWIIVTKVDLSEVHAPIEREAFWLGLTAGSIILTIGIGITLILRDLTAHVATQRHEAEARQLALRHHYNFLTRFVSDNILLSDENGVIVDANDRALSSYGYSRQELIGMPLRSLWAPEEQGKFEQEWNRTLEHDGEAVETHHRRKDESTFPAEVTTRRVAIEDTVLRQSIVRDITERKEAEQERHRLQEQLQQAQRLESVGRLAGGVAHDFNNLLTVINGYSSMLVDALPDHDPLHASAREIADAGHRAANLTRQLLAFSRKQVIAPKLLSLNTVIGDLVKMLRRLVGEDITIVTDLAPALAPVFVDPGQMEQVLMNLATNARDAMPQGGQIIISTQNVEIDESYAALHVDAGPGPHVLLTFTDTGEGMSPETMHHAFEPFFTTKPRGQGTGLGLATVYGAIKQNNGWILVYSEPGKGTTFKIYLRQVASAEGPGDDPERGRNGTRDVRGKETILLVEDQDQVRKLAVRSLSRYGYQVLEAANAEEALWLSGSTNELDLLITDVIMPGLNGPELAGRLTSSRQGRLKVLYISGYTENLIARDGALPPGVAFLQKPFTGAALAQKVRELLDGPA